MFRIFWEISYEFIEVRFGGKKKNRVGVLVSDAIKHGADFYEIGCPLPNNEQGKSYELLKKAFISLLRLFIFGVQTKPFWISINISK